MYWRQVIFRLFLYIGICHPSEAAFAGTTLHYGALRARCFYGTSPSQNLRRGVQSPRVHRWKSGSGCLGASSSDLEVTTTKRVDLVSLQKESIKCTPQTKILSSDPLVYLVPNLLSEYECKQYQEYAQSLEDHGRPMTLSNPPQVSLELAKLWPLPLLSMGAGIPPALRLLQIKKETSSPLTMVDMVQAALPNVAIALVASCLLALGVLTLVQRLSKSSSRTSVAAALNMEQDVDFIRPLVERVSAVTSHPWTRWEAPVVTRYDPGAIFARHGDASPLQGEEWKGLGGQRVVTCICYLNTLGEGQGGETFFDQLGIAVAPVQGTGLFFFPSDGLTWKADDRTTHESLPPATEKWIVQLFGRAERVPPPLGIPDVFDGHEKLSSQ